LTAGGRALVRRHEGRNVASHTDLLERFRLAGAAAPNGLFKFFRYGTDQHKQWVHRLLQHNEIYFSTQKELNDPFELKVHVIPDPDRGAARKALKTAALRGAKQNKRPWREAVKAQEMAGRVDLEAAYRKLQDMHNTRMETQAFILCFCGTRKNILMWSHYADGHKGLCVHFDSAVYPLVGAAGVEYRRRYPVTHFPSESAGGEDDLLIKSILTKSRRWRYEKEFRLFAVRMGDPPLAAWWVDMPWDQPNDRTAHKAFLPRNAITGVTIGASMPQADRESLIAICGLKRPQIKIEIARVSDSRYSLLFDPLKLD
jgi:hypothetical protein